MTNKKLDLYMKNLIDQRKIRSGSYCIAKDGKVVSCNAMGDMDLGNGLTKSVSMDTLFEIQSITKMITAAAILILQERGQCSVYDKVGTYIEEFNQDTFSCITIMHLLTHSSGIVPIEGAFADRDLNWENGVDETNVADSWISAVLRKGLYYEPGSKWEYSMAGFCILGEIIARITGERAEDFIRREILNPCDMRETHWKREITDEWALRYLIRTERHRQQYAMYPVDGKKAFIDSCTKWSEIPETAGGLMSTLQDLIRFGIMLSEGGVYKGKRILHEESLKLLEENQLRNGVRDFCWGHGGIEIVYGAGCAVYDSRFDRTMCVSEKTIYHEGLGTCVLMVNRKDKLAAVWDVPFFYENEWYAEAVKGIASIIWNTECR